MFQILLAPSKELAETVHANASVEAEYGDFCVPGKQITLAHHGSRSSNPAPCNTQNIPVLEMGTILISHLDLDTVGGILAIMGEKYEDAEFWQGAEMIDVKGWHHIHELPVKVQNQLNAFYAWAESANHGIRYSEITDVTAEVMQMRDILHIILNPQAPEHEKIIKSGIEWEQNSTAIIESKLIWESEKVRCFITDGIFCSASYYSPNFKKVIPATVACNTTSNSITVAFADGGQKHSACEIVQSLWGPEAGGHAGIAGCPRNWSLSPEELRAEFDKCCKILDTLDFL